MAKLNLSQTYVYAGKFYGPGEVDLPEDAHKALKAREDALKAVADTAAEAAEPEPVPAKSGKGA